MAKQDDFVRYTIRVPPLLYQRVVEAAEMSGRSINAEITARLEDSFAPERKADMEALLAEFRRHVQDSLEDTVRLVQERIKSDPDPVKGPEKKGG